MRSARRALDRAGDELGKEHDARGELARVALRGRAAPVHLEAIPDELEHVVRDAERSDQRQRAVRRPGLEERRERRRVRDEERSELVEREHTHVDEHGAEQQGRPAAGLGPPLDPERGGPVHERQRERDDDIASADEAQEHRAREDEPDPSRARGQERVEQQPGAADDQVFEGVDEHAAPVTARAPRRDPRRGSSRTAPPPRRSGGRRRGRARRRTEDRRCSRRARRRTPP